MDYNEFLKKLNGIRPIVSAVDELFAAARGASEQRFFLALLDLHAIEDENTGKRNLILPYQANWYLGLSQFSEYFGRVVRFRPSEFSEEGDANFARRLQMLAYSQFWEHLAVQRLLLQLVRICCDETYEPCLLWKNFRRTNKASASVYKDIISKSKKQNLDLGRIMEVLYSNQIRNAFAHSQFYFVADLVCFENHNPKIESDVVSLKLSSWDALFECTEQFVQELFRSRRQAEAELNRPRPIKFVLPEFKGSFVIDKDERGEWNFADNIQAE